MVSGFLTKKIKSRLALGQRFGQARKRKKITISQAEAGTKVKAKYLLALEAGDWSTLPQEVYVRGFVLSYAKFLGLDKDEILSLFESEAAVKKSVDDQSDKISYNQTLDQKKVLITPKLLGYSTLGIFVLSMFSYIIFQLAAFAGNPTLNILKPVDNSIYEVENIDLAGTTEENTIIMVNDEKVPVTSDGHFSLNLKLHRGVNVVNVTAVNKIKKETSKVFTVEYKPKTAAAVNPVVGQ